jgi:hypothetical protein
VVTCWSSSIRAADLDRRIAELRSLRDDLRAWPCAADRTRRRRARPTWSATSSSPRRRNRSLASATGDGQLPCTAANAPSRQTAADLSGVGDRKPERAVVLRGPGVGRGRRLEELHEWQNVWRTPSSNGPSGQQERHHRRGRIDAETPSGPMRRWIASPVVGDLEVSSAPGAPSTGMTNNASSAQDHTTERFLGAFVFGVADLLPPAA